MSVTTEALTEAEEAVLRVLAYYAGDFGFFSFDILRRETALDRATIRQACRSLRVKGLAEFGRGLMNEDGGVAGSGYACTASGSEWFEKQLEKGRTI